MLDRVKALWASLWGRGSQPHPNGQDHAAWDEWQPNPPRPSFGARLSVAARSLFGRVEYRAVTSVPWDQGGTGSRASVSADTALSLVPVYAAIGLLARTISCTPVHGYRRISEEERQRITLPQLFAQLQADGALVGWLHRLVVSLATRGNAFGLVIARDGFGFPTAIQWLHPDQVAVDDTSTLAGPGSFTDPIWRWNGRVIHVGPANANSDVLHIPWFPVPGRVLGLSPIGAAASMISTGISAQVYADDWFGNGGIPPGTMKNSQKVIEGDDAEAIKARLVAAIRSRKPIVYGSDWDYNPIQIAPHEARFVETAKLTATQVAAIYDVPPERIGGDTGGNLTYSSPEQASLHLTTFSMRNWYELLEHTFAALLPNRQYVKFNSDSLARADLAARYASYKVAREIGLLSIDECRALEDLAPLPDGEGADHAPLGAAGTGANDPAMPGGNPQDNPPNQPPIPLRRPRAA